MILPRAELADTALRKLFDAAKLAFERAYAPYSRFSVGAAILSEDGRIYAAPNVENAAYPAGTCAEAGAISAMIGGGSRRIAELVVVGAGEGLCTPCGACRQVIREFGPYATIRSTCKGSGHVETSLDALLPAAFGPEDLGRPAAARRITRR
jgi:cytidine deaminase